MKLFPWLQGWGLGGGTRSSTAIPLHSPFPPFFKFWLIGLDSNKK